LTADQPFHGVCPGRAGWHPPSMTPETWPGKKSDEREENWLSGWKPADTRLLVITFGAGLAANITTVMVVALAIAFARYSKTTASTRV
jgi:hypothetical protein